MNRLEEFLASTNPDIIYALVFQTNCITVHYNSGATLELIHSNQHLFADLLIGLDLNITSIFIQVNRIGGPRIQFRDRLFTLVVSPPRQPQLNKKDSPAYKREVSYLYMEKGYSILESHELVLYNYLNLGSYTIPKDSNLKRR
jgi:hypothetical protein